MAACLPFLFGRKPEIRSSNSNSDYADELPGVLNVELYSYRELRAATENFSSANKIGEGGFGPVFKGRLRNGKMAAIKILSAESKQGVREFLTEIQVISEIHHENLVELHGCCVEGGHRILVYHYLENNSIAQTLLDEGNTSISFSWPVRVNICIGVAKGLAFLHEEVSPHIIHRDIKASNVLLDEDLNPKISDFGLAKLILPGMTHISTRVAGTMGYLAPEYAIQGRVTRHSDTYSFGVLLIEIVSGMKNTNKRLPMNQRFLIERAWHLYEKNEVVGLVDEALNDDFDVDQACRFIKIGLLCTQDDPSLRPAMSTVVRMLMGSEDVDETKITMPGLISDLKDFKSNRKSPKLRLSRKSNSRSTDNAAVPATTSRCSHAGMTFSAVTVR